MAFLCDMSVLRKSMKSTTKRLSLQQQQQKEQQEEWYNTGRINDSIRKAALHSERFHSATAIGINREAAVDEICLPFQGPVAVNKLEKLFAGGVDLCGRKALYMVVTSPWSSSGARLYRIERCHFCPLSSLPI